MTETTIPELPYPSGWFALAQSAELKIGAVKPARLAGRELVLFRTEDGVAHLVSAYCPHLGAHLGHGGTVQDGTIVCPFHGFRFAPDGACVATGYGTRAPKGAALQCHAVGEAGGWVFGWYHPEDLPPSWALPEVPMDGYAPVQGSVTELRTHPQETTENSVDLGHFPFVHGYRDMQIHALETEGPHLHTRYAFVRPDGFPGLGRDVPVEISVNVWGLGFSFVDVLLPKLGLHTRQYVLPTPVAPRQTELRLGMALKRGPDADWRVRMVPSALFDGLVSRTAHRAYVRDVMQDRHIWEHKAHVPRPLLAEGDGPIGRYRAWCRQFYAQA
jgi:nitrite reductase/ring-hydroxylating ferredoxin subunit